jgi:hypothetical protein
MLFAQTEAKRARMGGFQRKTFLKLTDMRRMYANGWKKTMRQHYKALTLDAEDEEEGHYDVA